MNSSESFSYKYQFLLVEFLPELDGVLKVGFNRPDTRNAFNISLFEEYRNCFQAIKKDPRVRCVIVYGSGAVFTSGIDYKEIFKPSESEDGLDTARVALKKRDFLMNLQDSLTQAEKCDKPVIMAVHGSCIGVGVEIILAGDIRLCTIDTKFHIKEVDFSLAADVGALQRLPKAVNNYSWAREVCLTARMFDGVEALRFGLVSQAFDKAAINIATKISKKSPVATLGTKHLLNYSRDHSVAEGLEYTAIWNSSMLQTQDIPIAIEALISKSVPKFSKL